MADSTTNSITERDPRVYFAAERTFLAWIRTGIGLVGVGFAVARFGLFLREMRGNAPSLNVSVPSGVALVMLGVAVNVYATARHVGMVRALRDGSWEPGQISRGAVALALVLAAIGVGMAVYLLIVH